MENNNYYNDNFNQNNKLMIIEINKPYYFKGENIEGNIIINCLSNITLNEITLCLYSKENWVIQETSTIKYGEKNNQLLSKFDIEINKLLNNRNDIQILPPGTHIFHFNLELPNYLQPSFEYPLPNRSAYLRYLLESEIISNEIKSKYTKYILIKGSFILLKTPKIFTSVSNVHKWGIFDGGSTILKVSYKKNNFKIYETVPLNIEIDNSRGKLKVKECKIRILRTIQFNRLDKNSIEKFPMEKTIYSKIFWSEVFANSKRNFLFQTELKDKDLIDFCYFGENNPYPSIKDINLLLPTLESRLIKCQYRIQISLYFDSFVTSGYRPRVYLPIIINHQFQEEDNNLNNSQIKNFFNNENYYNNNICESSLVYDNNFFENYQKNKNSNLIGNINESKNNEFYYSNNNVKFSQIMNESNDLQIKNQNIHKKEDYIQLNKEKKYNNINEI